MVQTTNNFLGTTRDGYRVYDRLDSHFHHETGLTPKILRNALSKIYANNKIFKHVVAHMGKIVGYSNCVPVSKEDLNDIVMVYRKGREGLTPMIKNRRPIPCRDVTIIIRKEQNLENHYTLITAFIGSSSEPEPWDKRLQNNSEALKKSKHFWDTHALIYNPDLIDFERNVT